MRISIGSDHGGFILKEEVIKHLNSLEYEVTDCGTYSLDSSDYPIYAKKVANDVKNDNADFGILICTTGIGMSITANKVKGVRAALISNLDAAHLTRKHNNSNVICLGAKYTSVNDAIAFIDAFLNEKFEGGRHERRVNLIEE